MWMCVFAVALITNKVSRSFTAWPLSTEPAVLYPEYVRPSFSRLDNAIQWINHYQAAKCQQNKPRYPLDSVGG